jgi:hypothetical protein
MSKRREPDQQYGYTHYFTLNDWAPQNTDSRKENGNVSSNEEISIENIPF